MSSIFAKIVADSISEAGVRLTTMHLRYPLVIHGEVMTHRVFSRNARSSRAVPIEKMIKEVLENPFVPSHWGKAQAGMQAYEECNEPVYRNGIGLGDYEVLSRENAWLYARDNAVEIATAFKDAGYAKQLVNRLLSPFLHIDTLCTATDWDNFFALRDHHAAEPHIQMLARAMKQAMAESVPNILLPGEWHLPYIEDDSLSMMERWLTVDGHGSLVQDSFTALSCKVSAARCARISYAPFEGNISIEKDLTLAVGLIENGHFSPLEHQATPDFYVDDRALVKEWRNSSIHRNFSGWCQYRALAEGGKIISPA